MVGLWIAARQMLIADERLKYDAFDRRYEKRVALYEATRALFGEGLPKKTCLTTR